MLLISCSGFPLPEIPPPSGTAPAPLGSEGATNIAPNGDNGAPSSGVAPARTIIGTEAFQPARPSPHVVTAANGNISFNYINAPVREVVREVLGDALHVEYVVDPKVQGTITAQTGAPIPPGAVLSTLESVLRASGIALLPVGDVYRIMPLEDASKAGLATMAAATGTQTGFGVRILPLKFVPAEDMKNLLQPFVPATGTLQADGARNVLIISGSATDLEGFSSLVRQFDVDWLEGKSLGIYPLHVGTAKDVTDEVQSILQQGGNNAPGPLSSLVRVVPIERLNAVLVITSQPEYLSKVKSWIDRLDYGNDETTPRIFNYHVQNSRATDVARVLSQLLSSGSVRSPTVETVPGSQTAQIGSQNGGGAGQAGGLAQGGGLGQSNGLGQNGAFGNATSGSMGNGLGLGQQSLTQQGAQAGQGQPAGAQRSVEDQELSIAEALGGDNSATGNRGLQTPPVRIVADDKNNELVIYARPRDYRMLVDVIQRLDIVPLQVLIEATIAEVTLSDSLQYGLQYFLKSGSSNFEFTNSTGGNLTTTDISGVFPGFNYVLSAANQVAVLNLLRSVSNVRVISSPQLLVLDHRTASLQVGDQVPIITQSAQSLVTADAPVVNSVQYQNTGVLLQVTPRVNSTGLVTLDIDQEVSEVAPTTSSTINSPTIDDRHINTSVIVRDGQTIALGGLILENRSDTKSGIPILSSIPLIGPLFRNTSRSNGRTELLVLLSPKVVRNPMDAQQMTDDLRERMRTLKPLNISVH